MSEYTMSQYGSKDAIIKAMHEDLEQRDRRIKELETALQSERMMKSSAVEMVERIRAMFNKLIASQPTPARGGKQVSEELNVHTGPAVIAELNRMKAELAERDRRIAVLEAAVVKERDLAERRAGLYLESEKKLAERDRRIKELESDLRAKAEALKEMRCMIEKYMDGKVDVLGLWEYARGYGLPHPSCKKSPAPAPEGEPKKKP